MRAARWGRVGGAVGAALVTAVAGVLLVSSGGAPVAGASPGQAAGGTLSADPTEGLPGEPLRISGTGCAGGIVTVRIDGAVQGGFPTGDAEGDWSAALTFPGSVGPHEVDADCSDFTTVGAPTTFYGPGDLRFTYDAVTVQTDAPVLVDPTVDASDPTLPAAPEAPVPATPAAPSAASPAYTG